MDSWQRFVELAKELGFDKVCIIARANFKTLASSGLQDIATYWPAVDGFPLNKDKLNKVVECISRKWMKDQYIPEIISWIKIYYDRLCFVNENQEILDDWRHPTKTSFNFFGDKHMILIRDDKDGKYVVSQSKHMRQYRCCIAYQFRTIWFIVAGEIDNRRMYSGLGGFQSTREAFSKIMGVFDSFEEAGI